MPKFDARTKMSSVPFKPSPFDLAPESSPSIKYGWSPSWMDDCPFESGQLENGFSVERENRLAEPRKIDILDGLLKEAAF